MNTLPPLTGRACECPTCLERFVGETAFDAHRFGKYGRNRRCMTAQEMLAAGMQRNRKGYWSRGAQSRASAVAA